MVALAVLGLAALVYGVAWARWRNRDHKRRSNRLAQRERRRDELERTARRLRLRITDVG